jgi:hypothetical protein
LFHVKNLVNFFVPSLRGSILSSVLIVCLSYRSMSETLLKIPGIIISSCFIRVDVDVLIDEHPDESETLDGLRN